VRAKTVTPSAIGVVHGRFQILHLDHLKYILAAKRFCDTLIVGITSPDPSHTTPEPADANRGDAQANPCTYYERMLMIEGALTDEQIPRSQFQIVTFPIGRPELIPCYAPPEAEHFLTIYDDWGQAKLERLQGLNLKTHVLWRRSDKGLTASRIRTAIKDGTPWSHMVPPATRRVVREREIDKRICAAAGRGASLVAGGRS
jgi:cytidyltransferase-like protein